MCMCVLSPSWWRKLASTALRLSRCSCAMAPARLYRLVAMASNGSRVVLVTGCSSGIGHATAKHLTDRGWTVYATARRPETLSDLEAAGCTTLALDVTDEASMRSAVDRVEADHGAVG